MSFADWFSRLALAIVVSIALCVPAGLVLLRISGAPPEYAPLLPQQVFAATFGGSLLIAIDYALLAVLIQDKHTRFIAFFTLGALLLLLSFNLPYRLRSTQSPRFISVTFAAQIAQGMLHTLVVGTGIMCFVTDKSMWE